MKQLELPFDHEPSLTYWAIKAADEDLADGTHTDWEQAYDCFRQWVTEEIQLQLEEGS